MNHGNAAQSSFTKLSHIMRVNELFKGKNAKGKCQQKKKPRKKKAKR